MVRRELRMNLIMKKTLLHSLVGVGIAMLANHHVLASSPLEKLICTNAPRSEWLPESKMREIFGDKEFSLVKFKVSSGNCYEFYAVHKDGSIVEAYYDPVSGKSMRYNRVLPNGATPAYEATGKSTGAGK